MCRIISCLNPRWRDSGRILVQTQLSDFRNAYPDELSGGMKQRVEIAGPVHPARPLVDGRALQIPGPSFEAGAPQSPPGRAQQAAVCPSAGYARSRGGRTPRRSGDLAFPAAGTDSYRDCLKGSPRAPHPSRSSARGLAGRNPWAHGGGAVTLSPLASVSKGNRISLSPGH